MVHGLPLAPEPVNSPRIHTIKERDDYWLETLQPWMDHWAALAQYAVMLLGCPAASMISEYAFSAVGGFVTDRRVHLSMDTVDWLLICGNEPVFTETFD